MFRRIVRLGFIGALLGGAGFAAVKIVQSRRAGPGLPSGTDWLPPKRPEKPLVEPEMLHGVALKPEGDTFEGDADLGVQATQAGWVEPEDGACPASHPIKAKMSSGIFHLPGMLAYDRTVPDRCYADEAGAEADGLRKAKR
ncbi:MAG: hypothetical protein ACRD12_22390 [Acidimicrobiales bacterium]